MLYEIKEVKNKFKLLFAKKSGFKFKKEFTNQKSLLYFLEDYLRYCCLPCKKNGWVYKTQFARPLRSSISGGAKSFPQVGTITICPECKTAHQVQHTICEWIDYGGNSRFIRAIELMLHNEE